MVSGYENLVNFVMLEKNADYTHTSKLTVGAPNMIVSAFEVFDELDLLLTIDEYAEMKLWNLSDLKLL